MAGYEQDSSHQNYDVQWQPLQMLLPLPAGIDKELTQNHSDRPKTTGTNRVTTPTSHHLGLCHRLREEPAAMLAAW